MNILYISTMCSSRMISILHKRSSRNPGFAVQKFNRLIAQGLAKNGCNVSTLSAIPARPHDVSIICKENSEKDSGVFYRYIPFINIPGLRQFCLFIYSFFFTLIWGLRNRKDKRLVFDVLNISVCIGGLFAAKINRVESCGIVTDMPGLMVAQTNSKFAQLSAKVNKKYIRSFDKYVFLTAAMNDVINIKNRPYIVMEGLVDSEVEYNDINCLTNDTRSIMYAGGLFERYGIKTLIDAFMQLSDSNLRLDLYGQGPMVNIIREYEKIDPRIKYHGVATNDVIVQKEKEAILLINPRPTSEEFTRYSFPSKNMEYMVSGTAVATTCLPGMPKDYYPYVFLLKEETVEGFRKALSAILKKSNSELEQFGKYSREFVLNNKNNIQQTSFIVALLD